MKNISKKILLTSLIVFSQAKLHSMLGKVNTLKVFSKTNFLLKSKASLNNLKKFSNSKKPKKETPSAELIDIEEID